MKKLTAPHLLFGKPVAEPDIRHATGFSAADPVVVLLLPRQAILVVSSMELGRARVQATGCRVETPASLNVPPMQQGQPAAWAVAVARRYAPDGVQVDATFPVGAARQLEANGIVVTLADDSPVAHRRVVKTADEIAKIARVQKAARAAMRAVGNAIRNAEADARGRLVWNGKLLTSERAHAIVRETVLEHDCIDEDTIIAGGAQAADPHERGHGPLKTGEWVVCDIFPRSLDTGYWGDMTRTFMHGRPSPWHAALHRAVKAAQRDALDRIRHGAKGGDIHNAVNRSFEDAGFKTGVGDDGRPFGFIHSTGHGVGLEIHEEPRLSPRGGRLAENMVVTVEPGLYYPGRGGVRIEDLVVVGRDGPRIL
ncbi:MAG: M24 family metallopeptidase [Kiritimatiellia bacterium]|jgi:Xaa-Pro aminopeptidase